MAKRIPQRLQFIAERNARSLALVCPIHNVNHVRFGDDRDYSHGCPKCVEAIRNDVQALHAAYRNRYGKPFAKKAA